MRAFVFLFLCGFLALSLISCSARKNSLRFGTTHTLRPIGSKQKSVTLPSTSQQKKLSRAAQHFTGKVFKPSHNLAKSVYKKAHLLKKFSYLKKKRSPQALLEKIERKGLLHAKKPLPGSFVFFKSPEGIVNQYGIVKEVLDDNTVVFVHMLDGLVVKAHMNLVHQGTRYHPQTQRRLNHLLDKGGFFKSKLTTAESFVAFGQLDF